MVLQNHNEELRNRLNSIGKLWNTASVDRAEGELETLEQTTFYMQDTVEQARRKEVGT